MSGDSFPRLRRASFLRGLLLQSCWSFEALQGVGFAYMIDPWLRDAHQDPRRYREAALAHLEPFSTSPSLAGIVVGSIGALERDAARAAGEEELRRARGRIARLKKTLGPGLAALGDKFFWGALRPACASAAVTLWALRGFGARWAAPCAAAAYLVAFNAPAFWMRWAGIRLGCEGGEALPSRLPELGLTAWRPRVRAAGLALALLAASLELAASRGAPHGGAPARLALLAGCVVLLRAGVAPRSLYGAAALAGAIGGML